MAHLTGCNGGKGSQRRRGDDQKAYADNWERIFGKKADNVETVEIVEAGEADASDSSDV